MPAILTQTERNDELSVLLKSGWEMVENRDSLASVINRLPAMPLAIRKTLSLVEVSLSTVMALKLSSLAARRHAARTDAGTAASVPI